MRHPATSEQLPSSELLPNSGQLTANSEQGTGNSPVSPSSHSRRRSSFILHPSSFSSSPRAFTLTELLVVITIIAILAGLASVGVMSAMGTAKQTRIKTELDTIDMALKAYKEQYGSYPPCDLRIVTGASPGMPGYNAPLRAHVARAFPRYDQGTNAANLIADLATYVDTHNFRPDQAIAFWLGGFNPDPTQPFTNLNNIMLLPKAQRTPAFFNFDPTRLIALTSTSNPWTSPGPNTVQCPSYIPQGSKGNAPYVYYDAATILSVIMITPLPIYWFDSSTVTAPNTGALTAGICMPYTSDPTPILPTGGFVNPDSFQVISAGTDDIYGRLTDSTPPGARYYPSGTNYDPSTNLADDDNVANFCNRARLGDAKP